MTDKPDLPWFKFFPKDWLSSTDIGLMTAAEEGAYLRLLCHEWESADCSLPDDDLQLAVLSRLGTKWKSSAPLIRGKFTTLNGRLFNEKLVDLWGKAISKSKKSASASAVRWQCERIPNGHANDIPRASESVSVSSYLSSGVVVKATEKQTALGESWFEQFWASFWRKAAKATAKKAFLKKVTTPELFAVVMAAIRDQTPCMMLKEEQFRPHASTWINGERWEDATPELPGIEKLSGGERAVIRAQRDFLLEANR